MKDDGLLFSYLDNRRVVSQQFERHFHVVNRVSVSFKKRRDVARMGYTKSGHRQTIHF